MATRSGTITINRIDSAWEEQVYQFVAAGWPVASDPFWERPPHTFRGWWRWVKRIARWTWRMETGRPIRAPFIPGSLWLNELTARDASTGESIRLEGVTLHTSSFTSGFTDEVVDREIPFTWKAEVPPGGPVTDL
jgi:hypothetical protein